MDKKATEISFISGNDGKFESKFSRKLYEITGYYENDFEVSAKRMENKPWGRQRV